MPSGFQAFTDSGVFQIDGDTVNYGLRQRSQCGTSVGGAGSNTFFNPTGQLTFAAQSPIIAVRAPYAAVAMLYCRNNGDGTWTATFWSSEATTFDVFVFDPMSACPPSGSRTGFQVFNGQGVLVADSAIPFLRVLAPLSGTLTPANGSVMGQGYVDYTQQWAFGVPSVATIIGVGACTVVASGLTIPVQNIGKVETLLSAWRHSGGTAVMQATRADSNQFPFHDTDRFMDYRNWSGLIIDVTNL